MHGSSLISQLWSPKLPVSTDDGYSSPKSGKDSDVGEDDDQDQTEVKKQSWLQSTLFCQHTDNNERVLLWKI